MEIRKKLDEICGMVEENVPLSSLTGFRTGGPARYLLSPRDICEANKILSLSAGTGIPLLVIGNGTNLLISDEGFEGIVLTTKNLNHICVENQQVICESGVHLSTLLKTCLISSLAGSEFLAGIPGTVGGAVISNAGLKTVWFSEIIKELEVLPIGGGKSYILSRREIDFRYRSSGLENVFIYRVSIQLQKGESEKIRKEINRHMEKRLLSQPLEYPSAGSVFKNPPGHFAGELIEKCGLKGLCKGGACISEKHANFIVNKSEATSAEIYSLINIVKEKVKRVYNINLETEIKIVGKF